MADRTTYLLVDGENIDATLGVSVLGRRPEPQERPRWNTLLEYTEAVWDQPVKGLFFLAVAGELPASFVQALLAMGYRPVPLRGEGKVVDIAIQRTAEALDPRIGRGAFNTFSAHLPRPLRWPPTDGPTARGVRPRRGRPHPLRASCHGSGEGGVAPRGCR